VLLIAHPATNAYSVNFSQGIIMLSFGIRGGLASLLLCTALCSFICPQASAQDEEFILVFLQKNAIAACKRGDDPAKGLTFEFLDAAVGGEFEKAKLELAPEDREMSGELESLKLKFSGNYEPAFASGGGVRLELNVENALLDEPRALSVRCSMPVNLEGWTWWDGFDVSRTIEAGAVYESAVDVGVGSTGSISKFPFCAVSNGAGKTMCIGLDPQSPRAARLAYDGDAKMLYVQFDIATSPNTEAFPDQAPLSLLVFASSGGFRGAVKDYHELFPQAFSNMSMKAGGWMPFGDLSTIERPRDFFFAHHQAGGIMGAVPGDDDRLGVNTFVYSEPWSFRMPMQPDAPRTVLGIADALENAAGSTADYNDVPGLSIGAVAKVAAATALADSEGNLVATPEKASGFDGAVVLTNASPYLDGTEDGDNRAMLVNRMLVGAAMGRGKHVRADQGWRKHGEGYTISKRGGPEGEPAIRLGTDEPGEDRGAVHEHKLAKPSSDPISISAWYRPRLVTGDKDEDFAVRVEMTHEDGSESAVAIELDPAAEDWEKVYQRLEVESTVTAVKVYAVLQGEHTGSAWFTQIRITYGDEDNRRTQLLFPVMPRRKKGPSGKIDGLFVDSVDRWALQKNYAIAQMRRARYPLAFDSESKKPVILNAYSQLEMLETARDQLHASNILLMGSGAATRTWMMAPQLDVLGSETNWRTDDGFVPPPLHSLQFMRMMSGLKPYHFLLNTDFSVMTEADYERYFRVCAVFGIYPGMSSAGDADSSFWSDAGLYEKQRLRFLRYMPLIRNMNHAGWQPKASVAVDGDLVVEQYGTEGSVFIALYNPTAEEKTGTWTLGEKLLESSRWVHSFDGGIMPYGDDGMSVTLPPYGVAIYNLITSVGRTEVVKDRAWALERLLEERVVRQAVGNANTAIELRNLWRAMLNEKAGPSARAAWREVLFWSQGDPLREGAEIVLSGKGGEALAIPLKYDKDVEDMVLVTYGAAHANAKLPASAGSVTVKLPVAAAGGRIKLYIMHPKTGQIVRALVDVE
jgi:hypothetical protein